MGSFEKNAAMSLDSTQTTPSPGQAGARAWQVARAVLPVAGLIGVFCIAFFGEQGLMANHELRQQMTELSTEIEQLRTNNASLQEQVRQLQEDPAMIEDTIREEMFMVREDRNEVVFTFPDQAPAGSGEPRTDVGNGGDGGGGTR